MRLKASTVVGVAAAFLLGGAVGAVALLPKNSIPLGQRADPIGQSGWVEVSWPFANDEWSKGKAFQCSAAHCGVEVNLYIRAKIGFCNCSTGVSDDAELERLSDFTLMGDGIKTLGDGRPIDVAWMKGRSRPYAIAKPIRAGRSALSIAFNNECDAIVATIVFDKGDPTAIEANAIAFLNNKTVLRWAEATLGL